MGKKQRRMEVFDARARYYPSAKLTLEELSYWIAFSRVMGIGPVRFQLLLDHFQEDVASAWHAPSYELTRIGLDQRTVDSFISQRANIDPAHELKRLDRLRIQVITWKDACYPPLLRKIDYAPPVLYACGQLTEDDLHYSIGIVGTRKMSSYGRQVTEHFTKELVKGKITIVSGLALGVDTVAHNTALDNGGRTIAVLACGLDTIYPPSNYHLAKHIVDSGQGVLLSSFPLGIKPEAGNFPARNHIISGLSLGILVTEAPPKSGALITANSALVQGREVYAVPSSIFSNSGAGVNKLIRDGAHPVTEVSDILEHLNIHTVPLPDTSVLREPENEEERLVLALLSREPRHIDDLIRDTELAPNIVTSTLTILELDGLVKQVGSMQYVRCT
ncbi:DNA-processing protein DprA [Dictyobacter aurantiacus]|uniref:DNA processing protein DprA n=1 Tax=Dictyobacter aurantiacus TaxID=1936993 RepID=A0A401ZB39_9CHLR|nr:DNA-processing protein DprA [Dictyobacter aurantiacus]GCE04097.1 DNA processing protein DprA [Dictyobacter aurantiacus]